MAQVRARTVESNPVQSFQVDDALVRMRRSLEWAGIISRAAAVLWIALSLTVFPRVPGMSTVLGIAAAVAEALINLLGVHALRSVGRRRYPHISAVLLAVDTAAIIAMVYSSAASPDLVFWPLLIIPIIVGAYRHQLTGALTVFAAESVAGILLYLYSPQIAGHQVPADLVSVAPGLELVVAVLTGLLSRAHHNHLGQLAAARASLREQAAGLREQALHDPLTGLGNRHLLHEHARSTVHPGVPASVLVLDLDGFKAVNDTLGHAAGDELLRVMAARLRAEVRDHDLVTRLGGDELLRVMAARLRAEVRDHDLVTRLGGDEFLVLLHDTDAHRAHEVAARLRASLTEPVRLGAGTVSVDASIGTATARDGDLDNLMRVADAEMYRIKSAHHLLRAEAAVAP
ncbi:diguanylate cyclase [Dactylosporangium sp. CA-052675]|uniref:diguanylate cyclase n=1 Tax=Dactylosporangium sp. CA-052675 TaxID=3239927 RepID=UPI003D8DAEC9